MSFHILESVNWDGYKLVFGTGYDYEYLCCRDLNRVGQFKSLDVRTIASSYKAPPVRSLPAQTEQVAIRANSIIFPGTDLKRLTRRHSMM